MTKIIKIDGSEINVDKEQLTLEFMQKTVGGYIQIVPFPNGDMIVCNEEGKLNGLPANEKATKIWSSHFGHTDIIVGNVIIAKTGEIE